MGKEGKERGGKEGRKEEGRERKAKINTAHSKPRTQQIVYFYTMQRREKKVEKDKREFQKNKNTIKEKGIR